MSAINRLRFELRNTTPVGFGQNDVSSIIDKLSNRRARLAFASAVRIEIAIFDHDTLDTLAGLTALSLEIRDAPSGIIAAAGAAILGPVVLGAGDFNTALTQDQWDNDSGSATTWHAAFTLTEANMTVATLVDDAVNNEQTMGLVIQGTGPSGRFILGSGLVTLVKTGATGAGSAVLPTVSYTKTDQDIDAGDAQAVKLGLNPPGAGLILQSPDGLGKILIVCEADPNGGYRIAFTPV